MHSSSRRELKAGRDLAALLLRVDCPSEAALDRTRPSLAPLVALSVADRRLEHAIDPRRRARADLVHGAPHARAEARADRRADGGRLDVGWPLDALTEQIRLGKGVRSSARGSLNYPRIRSGDGPRLVL